MQCFLKREKEGFVTSFRTEKKITFEGRCLLSVGHFPTKITTIYRHLKASYRLIGVSTNTVFLAVAFVRNISNSSVLFPQLMRIS